MKANLLGGFGQGVFLVGEASDVCKEPVSSQGQTHKKSF